MEWDPSRFFRPYCSSPYALLVLNQPINESALSVLYEHASFVICADGGANRLYEMMMKIGREITNLPDAVIGDLDSIHPAVREHYKLLGVKIIKDGDQYSTDFTKCLKYLNKHAAEIVAKARVSSAVDDFSSQLSSESTLEILVLGGLGGRVDQAFSQIHHLYTMAQTQRECHEASFKEEDGLNQNSKDSPSTRCNIYLISEESITFILQEGKNIIHTPATNRPDIYTQSRPELQETYRPSLIRGGTENNMSEFFFEENVGIVPLLGPASITTHGLEWDVQDWHTAIGAQLSTSNHIRADKIEIKTSMPVLFTVELAQRLKKAKAQEDTLFSL